MKHFSNPQKTTFAAFFHNHSWVSLAVIIFTLAFSVLLSMLISDEKKIKELEAELTEEKAKK